VPVIIEIRFHLAAETIRPVPRLSKRAGLIADCESRIEQSVACTHEHRGDRPEIRN
jgi:hypothetical protein